MIYQAKRHLIDGVNGLQIPFGTFVSTECELWAKRFGADLVPVGVVPTGVGCTLKVLTNLQEESLSVESSSEEEVPEAELTSEEEPTPLKELTTTSVPIRKPTRKRVLPVK